MNILTYDGTINNGTDGLQAKNGPVTVFVTSGTSDIHASSTAPNTLLELIDDTKKIQNDIIGFNSVTQSTNKFTFAGESYEGTLVFEVINGKSNVVTPEKVFIPFSKKALFESLSFRRTYMIVSDDVVDDKKYQTYKQQLIGNVIGNDALLGSGAKNIEQVFDEYWIGVARPLFIEENNITKSFIDNLEKTNLKNYLVYTPFEKKQRNFTFTTENSADQNKKTSQENMIKGLSNTTNQNTNINTWNDINNNGTGAFISKTKLN